MSEKEFQKLARLFFAKLQSLIVRMKMPFPKDWVKVHADCLDLKAEIEQLQVHCLSMADCDAWATELQNSYDILQSITASIEVKLKELGLWIPGDCSSVISLTDSN